MEASSFHGGRVRLYRGDCREALRELPDCSVDSVVTDPPYNLKFMGKRWDTGETSFDPEFWRDVLRVLKPGGHMLAFGGTRTFHRLACAIEDGGFEIRDAVMWHYGSGMPKSHDVSKAIDKAAGAEREVVGFDESKYRPNRVDRGLVNSTGSGSFQADNGATTTAPATDAAREWQGWGTALKPTTEIISLARKPLSEKTIAANVLRWGVGALNIDGCRVATSKADQDHIVERIGGFNNTRSIGGNGAYQGGETMDRAANYDPAKGRWPANVIHDGSDEVVGAFPESESSRSVVTSKPGEYGFNDSGSAARFFYTAKADIYDRVSRWYEDVKVEWISELGPCQAQLLVDTEPSPGRVIGVSGSGGSSEWSTFLFGNKLTDLCLTASKCTIETKTSSTIDSKIWSWLTRSLTNDCTAAASFETVNGGSLVESAERSAPSLIITSASPVCLPGASHAVSGTPLKVSVLGRRGGHPTVKPLDLKQYLIRLITRKGGTVLDMFAGTGTTAEAALREGMNCILCEREPEYQADIERRMEHVYAGKAGRRAAIAKVRSQKGEPMALFPEAAE